ncbi:Tyrocidine synthase 3 [Sporomusa ovata DSM 2662]|uniref:Malonyl CoA-acyl carrier protein transacylase n=1 Tax=Sporomusa ovata TaxID=2378 RepID=A0A0U1KTE1_9FIRM|nr:non-ribosomal peptide synthetase [Sporomusa ovata]EQB24973.1 amino acid adenylation domain containing protein [Sporomusa ovata DSM 2662]CQR70173.1 Malonyl CoA-acyl carrier protein transacylase [Sporomusa ovata]
MDSKELIIQLAQKEIRLGLEGEDIKVIAPKELLTEDTVDLIRTYKSDLLAIIKMRMNLVPQILPKLVPDPANRLLPFPLNDVQQAYWVGRTGAFELGNISTHTYQEFESKDIDLVRLQQAINKVIQRHEMLRAVILASGEQVILPEVPLYELPVMDLRGKEQAITRQKLLKIRDEMSHQVLPAHKWPLFEVRATVFNDDVVRLHISLDMLIVDLFSMSVLIRELILYYSKPELQLPPLELSFRDYVLAEKQLVETEAYKKAQNFWLKQIDTLPAGPELPYVKPLSSIQKAFFRRRQAKLANMQWESFKSTAKKNGLTPSVVLLTAYALVIASWAKNPRFTIDMTLFRRLPLHQQVNELVGDFTSVVLLEMDFSSRCTFMAYAKQVQRKMYQNLDNTYFSGIEFLRELAVRQNGKHRTLMPVVFTSGLGLDLCGGLNAAELPQDVANILDSFSQNSYGVSQTSQVWLDQQVFESKGGLVFNWDVVDELFPESMIDDMFHCYCGLLANLAEPEFDWNQEIHPVPPAQLAQRRQVNATDGSVSEKLLQDFLSEQIKLVPDKDAVITANYKLSYAQLFKRSNQLARHLRALGASPNTLVAVVMEKGWEQIVAVYGILFAGAAYLPIDADVPPERLHFLLTTGKCKIAVTQDKYKATLDWPAEIQTVSVTDSQLDLLDDSPLDNLQAPTDIAYVIFTSGSTGNPKGVVIDHRGAVNTILDINQRFGVTGDDCALAISNLNFDLSVYDIFGLHGAGGSIVLPETADAKDPARWLELLATNRITLWNSVPAIVQMLVEYAAGSGKKIPAALRLIMMSGDWIPVSLPEQIWRQLPATALYSLGGATEASIWSIHYPIKQINAAWTSIPYGTPLKNQRFQIYNEKLEPVPVWVPGQLYIGGIGLAKGYWKDEEKTKASFITHPVTGERLYRTGDLGRYLPDGTIEFLGREDFQVKINGYRIELGEIETALEQQKTVKTAVVAALGDKMQKRLVGYIVPCDYDQAVHDKEAYYAGINAYLRTKLPDYMIPGTYVLLEELPLTANGKVNRQCLPEPDLAVDSDVGRQIEPRTELEKKIADIWKTELKLSEIGINDNFFSIGGDSLTGVRINNRICQEFSVDLSLATLFETQTIAALALVIETMLQQGSSNSMMAELPAIIADPDNRYQVFPLTDLQQAYLLGRNAFFELGNVATHIYQEFEMKNVNIQKLNAALHTLIARHDMLRSVIVNSSEQKILETVEPYVMEVYDFRKLDKETREIRLREIQECMAHEMLPAGKWPLFDIRASVLNEAMTRLHVHLDMLIMDFTSVMTFFNEWMMLYQNPDVPLADIAVHYRDYVLTERKIKDTTLYQKSRSYWLSKVDSLAPAPELPLKTNPQTIANPQFRRKSSTLSSEQWDTLKERAKQQGITPSGILFAAYAVIIAGWSKDSRFTLNLTLANRLPLHLQIDQIIGDFTSVTLVELDYSRSDNFLSWAQHVQKAMLETIDHSYFSGVEIIRELVARRGGMREAIMPVVFTSGLGLNNELSSLFERRDGEFSSLSETSQVWLDQQVFESKGGLVFNWDVVDELFPDGMIDDMFHCYCGLLANLAEPEFDWNQETHPVPPAQLAQRRQVNATAGPVSQILLQDFLIEQVKLVPDKDAVITANYKLSYAQLFKRSNQLARHLRKLGASPNTLVAVVMEKGWEQIVAVYGILFAGAAYLPIDADVPPERLHFLLTTGECKIAVTQDKYKAALDWPAEIQTVSVTGSQLDLLDDSPLDNLQTPTDIAYVIFTSGSTGNPKGVVIDHRGAVNTILDINQRFGVTSDDCVLAISNLNFDLSVYDIFGLHGAGGSIVLPETADAKDPARWLALLAANRITLWNSVPAIVQMLVEYAAGSGKKIPAALRLIMMSGDWIPVSLPEQIWRQLPEAALYSLGGATEASIWSVHYPIKQVNAAWTSIPYGTPLKNQRFQIYNEKLEPVPVWVPGQLYIGGIGLAKGYWKDEEKTKASFITHPVTGERLYRTGDLGRYLPDGTIEFLGREDFQVKINGYRIELGEIEAALEKQETVKTAVVAALGDKTQKRLVGYIVPCDYDQAVNNKEAYYTGINGYLRTKLPDYMIPGTYVLLAELPLTANGKVDRQRLPVPDLNNTGSTGYAAPTNEIEERLVKVWQRVLAIADIGIKDNFFNIGGNSLKVIQLLTEIKQEFNGLEVSLQFLLKEPTIEKISKFLAMEATERNKKHSLQENISFLKTPDNPSLGLFCFPNSSSYATGEMFAPLAACLPDSIEVMAANMPGHGNQKSLLPTIQEVVELFTDFIAGKSDKPLYILGYCFGCLPAFELVRELEARNCVVDGLIMLSSMAPDTFGKHYFSKSSPAEMVQNLKLAGPAMVKMFENMGADDIVLNCTIVRNDLDAMMDYQYPEYKLRTPLYLFQGEADQYIESTQYLPNWKKYAQQVKHTVIPDAEHVFLESRTQDVADRLLSIVFKKEVENAKSLADLLKI